MSLTLLPQSGFSVMPWKNGGGTTIEIAVSPHGAGLDDFDWRVSMARVEGSGPFSRFADIDRCLCVLGGAGIVLKPLERGSAGARSRTPCDAARLDADRNSEPVASGRFRAAGAALA